MKRKAFLPQALFGLAMVTSVTLVHATGEPALELIATIPMPGVNGRIDHFAADVNGHRLFIAALGNNTVEVIDTVNNRRVKSVSGLSEPQGLIYVPESNHIYVANGSSGSVDVLDGASLALLRRINKLDDADNVRYDGRAHQVVIGYGNGALRILSTDSAESVADIRLSGHPESFQLEADGSRVFVNVPSANQVTVVDRSKGKVVGNWEVAGAKGNFPMALDQQGRRLFVGTRFPAAILVYDMDTGKLIAKLSIGGDTDDIFFDARRLRIYAICGEGRVDVFRAESREQYVSEGSIQTAPRARTGLFVPEEGKLYVAAPAIGAVAARVLVYRAL